MSLLPGAASVLVRDLLTGPRKPAQVLGSGRFCAYLAVADKVLAVETSDGLGLPRAVRLAAPSRLASFVGVRPGMPASVGEASVEFGQLTIRAVRWWQPRPVGVSVLPCRLADLAAALPPCPSDWSPDRPVDDLLGLGPGLTPAGDDVLAGMLLGSRSNRAVHTKLVREIRAEGPDRTTSLSAALLCDAMDGYAIPAVTGLLGWLGGRGEERAVGAAARVLRIGHTSGLALAWGVVSGARRALVDSKEKVA